MEAPSVEGGVLGYEKKRFDDAPTALPTAARNARSESDVTERKPDGPAGRKEHRA